MLENIPGFQPVNAEVGPLSIAAKLLAKNLTSVSILKRPSPASIIAGFVYRRASIVPEEPTVIVRSDRTMSLELASSSLPLFDPKYLNPTLLRDVINLAAPLNISPRLRWLAARTAAYRDKTDLAWPAARAKIAKNHAEYLRLHDMLSVITLLNREDPVQAFLEGQRALDRLISQPVSNLDCLDLDMVEIPFAKGSGEEEEIRYGDFTLDRRRALFLSKAKITTVVGGSPSSGKSTFAASLCRAMNDLLAPFYKQGVLDPEQVSVGLCDLDRATPTARYIYQGFDIPQDRKRGWSLELVQEALDVREEMKKRHNIIIADLPGGVPDGITRQLVEGADFSIWVDRATLGRTQPWQQFLWGPNLPHHLVAVHTVINDPIRRSSVRKYDSRYTGKGSEFLRGRAVDLNRELKPEEPFVSLAAKILLFDFFPEEIVWRLKHGYEILNSLDIDRMIRPDTSLTY